MKHVCCKRYLNRKWGELFTTTATDNEDNNNTTSCFWPIQHVPFKFICSSREIDSEPFKYSYLTTQLHLLVSFSEQKWVWACVHVLFARTTLLSVHFIFLLPLVTSRFNPPFLFNDYRLFSSRTHCIKAIYNSNNSSSSSSKLTHLCGFQHRVCNMCDTSTSYWNDWLCSYTTFYIYSVYIIRHTAHCTRSVRTVLFVMFSPLLSMPIRVCALVRAYTHYATHEMNA